MLLQEGFCAVLEAAVATVLKGQGGFRMGIFNTIQFLEIPQMRDFLKHGCEKKQPG